MKNNLSSITEALQLNPFACQSVRQKFKEKGWLTIAANPSEEELVTLVLGRIELDASQYGEFIAILSDVAGMDLIVNTLTGVPYDFLPIFYLWERGREEGRKERREGGRERERGGGGRKRERKLKGEGREREVGR